MLFRPLVLSWLIRLRYLGQVKVKRQGQGFGVVPIIMMNGGIFPLIMYSRLLFLFSSHQLFV